MLLAVGGNKMFTAPAEQTVAPPVEAEVLPPKKTKKKAEMPEGGDPIPDLTGKTEVITMADCRARTKDVIAKFEADAYAKLGKPRADATQKEVDAVMQSTMAFMMSVFEPFGIKKAPDLKPEQFAEYMAATEKLL
jgi:hypothetical protein